MQGPFESTPGLKQVESPQRALPWEVIDKILLYSKREDIAAEIKGDYNSAVYWGNLGYLKYLHRKNRCTGRLSSSCLEQCAKNNFLKVFKYCYDNIPFEISPSDSGYILFYALRGGNLDFVKYLSSINFKFTEWSINHAAEYGHLHIVQWLHENRTEGCNPAAMDYAAAEGHLDVLIWLDKNMNVQFTHRACELAANRGHLDLLKWLYGKSPEKFKPNLINHVSGYGDLSIRQWLDSIGSKSDHSAMDNAAMMGHLEIVKWLHENKSEGCTTDAMDGAAAHGHLEVVKWLHENRTEGCTVDAMNSAARNGDLNVVKWLHENRSEGCTTFAMDAAAAAGHLNLLNWLHENRAEGLTESALNGAIRCRHFRILEWMYSNYEFLFTLDFCRKLAYDRGSDPKIADFFMKILEKYLQV